MRGLERALVLLRKAEEPEINQSPEEKVYWDVVNIEDTRQYARTRAEQDDYEQEGFNGLFIAIGKFDKSRGMALNNYAYKWVRKYVLIAVRRRDLVPRTAYFWRMLRDQPKEESYKQNNSYFYEYIEVSEEGDQHPYWMAYPELFVESPHVRIERRELLQKITARLNERERELLHLHFYEDLEYPEIAEQADPPVTRAAVSLWMLAILRKLRRQAWRLRLDYLFEEEL